MRHGRLITFEGIEGSGKTTQIKKLAAWFRRRRQTVVVTREPGGTVFSERVRGILLDRRHRDLSPKLELLLYEVARNDHVKKVIGPALRQGRIVLCDRFTDATVAYQGFGRGFSHEMIERMNGQATGGLQPDLTILFDLPAAAGLRRSQRRLKKQRSHEGRFEDESVSLHLRVRQGYLQLARKNRKRFVVVDASRSPDQIFQTIVKKLQGGAWI